MSNQIQLEERFLDMVKHILAKHLGTQKVCVFGSRARGTALKYSDIDLYIEGQPLSYSEKCALEEDFTDSDLPYFVDVVQRNNLDEDFYGLIAKEAVPLKYNE